MCAAILIRPYRVEDAAALASKFHAAVQTGASAHYDQAQRDAWCAKPPSGKAWDRRLAGLTTFVAEVSGSVAGFMNIRPDGYLDMAFVAPERMGTGVADALYAWIEVQARDWGLPRITTQASHLAKSFFLRHGWTVDGPNTVVKGEVSLDNWLMSKDLIGCRDG